MEHSALVNDRSFRRSVAHFAQPSGSDLLARTDRFYEWQDRRRELGLWQYSRSAGAAPSAMSAMISETGTERFGLNFSSQDYLSLATHPSVLEAAHRAIREFGLHSAGSAMLTGNSRPSLKLEAALAEAMRVSDVALFPTGWGAGFGTIVGLVRRDDHILLDELSHACLQQGANAATTNVTRFPHLSIEAVHDHLVRIRSHDTKNAILVVTEGLFSMDSDTPDLQALQALCREFGATLLVDVAHDFGSMGPSGGGMIEAQGLLGDIDLVVGAFSKTFGTNGGFLAVNSPAVRQYVKVYGGPHIFSNGISPVQCAVVLEALRIVRSDEGDELRASLLRAAGALRGALGEQNLRCVGDPSPVVPVLTGVNDKVGRIASKLLFEKDVFANFVEYPAVPIHGSRFRMQVMATHTEEMARTAAGRVRAAIEEAAEIVEAGTEAKVPSLAG